MIISCWGKMLLTSCKHADDQMFAHKMPLEKRENIEGLKKDVYFSFFPFTQFRNLYFLEIKIWISLLTNYVIFVFCNQKHKRKLTVVTKAKLFCQVNVNMVRTISTIDCTTWFQKYKIIIIDDFIAKITSISINFSWKWRN